MGNIPIKRKRKDTRIATPIWLTDTDYPAPCPCGDPFNHGDQCVLVEGETGLKRLVHVQCMQSVMLDENENG